jgi:hypothetical protein
MREGDRSIATLTDCCVSTLTEKKRRSQLLLPWQLGTFWKWPGEWPDEWSRFLFLPSLSLSTLKYRRVFRAIEV